MVEGPQVVDATRLRGLIRGAVKAEGSMVRASKAWKVDLGLLSRVLSGKQGPGHEIPRLMGYEKIELWRKIE